MKEVIYYSPVSEQEVFKALAYFDHAGFLEQQVDFITALKKGKTIANLKNAILMTVLFVIAFIFGIYFKYGPFMLGGIIG